MKKRNLRSILVLCFFVLFLVNFKVALNAQPSTITIPDYSFGMIVSEYGTVTQFGVANPGPDGGYTKEEDQRPSDVWFAHGYRWWGYGSSTIACGPYPEFNFPGDHGVYDMWVSGCGNPPTGFMGSWGGVAIEPASRKIWTLTGAKKDGGPTQKYCVSVPWLPSGQMCYSPPSIWGRGESYGYLRKIVVITSTGTLKKGDPVSVKVKLTSMGNYEGDGDKLSQGVLMMNRQGNSFEYMRWTDVSDFFMSPMLARFSIDLNEKDSTTVSMAVGDTIMIEVAFNSFVKHENPGTYSEGVGWAGVEPTDLTDHLSYVRTDSIKKIIKKYGNSLTYDLLCLTAGAVLEPVTPDGPNLDEDKDGISDTREKGADGSDDNFDGNSDGIPDYKQSGVASFLTYNNQNYVTLVAPQGVVLSQMKVTDNPSKSDTPADAQFPFGFFDFSIDGLEPGEAVSATLILHNAGSINKYYKYGLTPDNMLPHWYDFSFDGQTGAQINENIITLHFVDGLRGDEDITVNGSIKEPGGPAITGTTGFEEFAEDRGIIVYPNPATNILTLRLNSIVPPDDYIINIYSITGALVHQKVIGVAENDQEFFIPVDHLPEGIYVITLSWNNFSYNSRFIKLK